MQTRVKDLKEVFKRTHSLVLRHVRKQGADAFLDESDNLLLGNLLSLRCIDVALHIDQLSVDLLESDHEMLLDLLV